MAKRGPSPTPKSILKARGSHRAKRNVQEPEPDQLIPDPPRPLRGPALKMWNDLSLQLDAMKVVTVADGNALHRYCTIWARWARLMDKLDADEEAEAKGTATGEFFESTGDKGQKVIKEHPAVKIAATYANQLLRLEQEFGLTPSARTGLQVNRAAKPRGGKKKSGHFDAVDARGA